MTDQNEAPVEALPPEPGRLPLWIACLDRRINALGRQTADLLRFLDCGLPEPDPGESVLPLLNVEEKFPTHGARSLPQTLTWAADRVREALTAWHRAAELYVIDAAARGGHGLVAPPEGAVKILHGIAYVEARLLPAGHRLWALVDWDRLPAVPGIPGKVFVLGGCIAEGEARPGPFAGMVAGRIYRPRPWYEETAVREATLGLWQDQVDAQAKRAAEVERLRQERERQEREEKARRRLEHDPLAVLSEMDAMRRRLAELESK
jgi:hypothetical protein